MQQTFPENLKELIARLEDPQHFLGVITHQYYQINLHWTSCRGDESIPRRKRRTVGDEIPKASNNLNQFYDTFQTIKNLNRVTDPETSLKMRAFQKFKDNYYENWWARRRAAFLECRHSASSCIFCTTEDDGAEGWPDLNFSDSELY